MPSDVNKLISDFSRFYILTILYEGPAHGYSIISKFRKRVGKTISPSLVYPFLGELEKKGLVLYTIQSVGEKDRKIFELTNDGKELCVKLFKRFANLVSTAIEPSLEVCAHCGCKVYDGGHFEGVDNKKKMFCCIHCANSYKKEMEQH
jgi:DNA-binding PadR family transcriptional regulator